jgi:FtsP/CotA-like multicopper oxidase with cupredoxin domain
MRHFARLILVAAVAALCPLPAAAQAVETHDNLTPAGTLRDGVLRVSLWAGMGQWTPSGPGTPPAVIAAFGEEGRPLSVPSPLLRAPRGTEVHVSIRNTLSTPLIVRGLCDRPAPARRRPSPRTVAAWFASP